MDKTKKVNKKLVTILIIAASLLLIFFGAAGILFWDELQIIGSIKKLGEEKPVYTMEIKGDYHFEGFLKAGGASSDSEVSTFLTNKISKGFYNVKAENKGLACSTISAKTVEGAHVWGRNFDWDSSVPIIVKSTPKSGYASISTCDFKNITGDSKIVPEGIGNQMLAIAAFYVPMDGINEAGLCVADLEVNEGGMVEIDTDKPDLTVTTAIRLLLNKAATVDEAVELLKQYDIHASGGISHHISISDSTGAAVSVEFVKGNLTVVNTNYVTNFNLAAGNTSAGGESAKQRYETMASIYEENNGILTAAQVKDALSKTAQSSKEQSTQWSVVYDGSSKAVDYYFCGDYSKPYSFFVGK